MIELCLVSMDPEEIRCVTDVYPCNCFADNPTVAVRALESADTSFFERSREVRSLVGDDVKLYLEVMGDTTDEMVSDAQRIVAEVGGNTLVKIPACQEGYRALERLRELGIRASCTAIFDVGQALLAARAGAVCVAVYVSRLDRQGSSGLGVVHQIRAAFDLHDIDCMVCAASLKTACDVEQALLCGAQNVTVDLSLLEVMASSPLGTSSVGFTQSK
ncbi:transaldolase family protein [Thermophilibacter immobilis]|uniref:Transaldolase n=1 Tax=Thermophilibacter immobilis TaxID=2779519 RepID=A0A7S7M7H1_9ACTN|nr:transaldolase family protein [Thermophilibacter immobilis]QOY60155.1 hypothetical protein INP52_06970 [Thermophilibacter immobilis]